MPKHPPHELMDEVRRAGYRFVSAEQLRATRWLLMLADPAEATIAVLVQMRSLIHAADVQDLADMIQLRRMNRAILWAYGGLFSAEAYRTVMELAAGRIELCTALPTTSKPTHGNIDSP